MNSYRATAMWPCTSTSLPLCGMCIPSTPPFLLFLSEESRRSGLIGNSRLDVMRSADMFQPRSWSQVHLSIPRVGLLCEKGLAMPTTVCTCFSYLFPLALPCCDRLPSDPASTTLLGYPLASRWARIGQMHVLLFEIGIDTVTLLATYLIPTW